MKTEVVKSIKVEFEGSEAEQFKSIVKKVQSESTKIGFNSDLNADEKKLISDLNKELNG